MNTELENCVEKMKETDTEITNRLVKIRQGFYKQNELIDSIAEELEMCFTKLFNLYFDMIRHEKQSKTETKEKTETEAKTESESKSEKPKRKPRAKKVTINESSLTGCCDKKIVLEDAKENIHTHPPKKNEISLKINEITELQDMVLPDEIIENLPKIDQN